MPRPPRILAVLTTASLTAGFLFLAPLAPAAEADTPRPGQIVVDPDNPRWFKYHEGGPFFMAGPGDPEDFLYRGRLTRNGTRRGDQEKLIQKLARSGANSIYFQAVRSHGGDGDSTHNPFIDNDPAKGLNPAVLDQWEEWFTEMDRHGIAIFFIFYDDSARIWETGDRVSEEERQFIHALVDRFEHHRHLIWVVAEEFEERYSWRWASKLAEEIHAADDHGHPVSIHRLSGVNFQQFEGDPFLNQYAMQYNDPSARRIHEGVVKGFRQAAGRYNVNMAEAAKWGRGEEARRKAWAAAMGGGYVMAFEMDIASTPMSDLEDCGRLVRFMESTDFHHMEPRDDLADLDAEYVLARPGVSYIVYSSHGEAIGLRELDPGPYRLRWLDLKTGREATTELSVGGGNRMLPRPPGIGSELAVYVQHLDPTPERLAARLPVMERLGTDEKGRPVKVAAAKPVAPAPAESARLDVRLASTSAPPAANGHEVAAASHASAPAERGLDVRLASADGAKPLARPIRLEAGELLFADDFDRPDSDHVGNDWLEVESDSRLEAREGRLAVDARDDNLRPIAARRFPAQSSGVVVWSFELDFKRTGGEKDYAFWMQLGNGAKMAAAQERATGSDMGARYDEARRRGVAVNLKWGGPKNGLDTHEGLGVAVDGRVRQFATVSGPHIVTVRADLDRRTYEVEVGGARVEGVAFDDDVAIDTVRFFADRLNLQHFGSREIDDVRISIARPAAIQAEAAAQVEAEVAAKAPPPVPSPGL